MDVRKTPLPRDRGKGISTGALRPEERLQPRALAAQGVTTTAGIVKAELAAEAAPTLLTCDDQRPLPRRHKRLDSGGVCRHPSNGPRNKVALTSSFENSRSGIEAISRGRVFAAALTRPARHRCVVAQLRDSPARLDAIAQASDTRKPDSRPARPMVHHVRASPQQEYERPCNRPPAAGAAGMRAASTAPHAPRRDPNALVSSRPKLASSRVSTRAPGHRQCPDDGTHAGPSDALWCVPLIGESVTNIVRARKECQGTALQETLPGVC